MNLQPMQPSPLDGNCNTFTVICCLCGKPKNSADVLCDLDGKAGDYYCAGFCAVVAEARQVKP